MSLKVLSLVLCFLIVINVSLCWSSTINSIIKPHTLMQINDGFSPDIVEAVAAGAQMAMDECKNLFKWDKWNCPQTIFSRQTKQLQTREKAFADAIIAAGIIYSITRDCSKGVIKGCGCDPKLNNIDQPPDMSNMERDWTWGGCSDDASFGENLVLKLLGDSEKYSDPQGFIGRHNNRLGREIIREKMLKSCKCHGISGSCTSQTCWMKMPTFPEIAKQLRERYDKSVLISFENISGALSLGNKVGERSLPEEGLPNNLLYIEKSPDYCSRNAATGWPGTRGRVCSKNTGSGVTLAEKRSCKTLCRSCGYKAKRLVKKISSRCNCRFTWCCEVNCDVCNQMVDEYYCV